MGFPIGGFALWGYGGKAPIKNVAKHPRVFRNSFTKPYTLDPSPLYTKMIKHSKFSDPICICIK